MTSNRQTWQTHEYPGKGWRKLSCGCINRYQGTAPLNGDIVMCCHEDHPEPVTVTTWRKDLVEVTREVGIS